MLDGLVRSPQGQKQPRAKRSTARSIYWTDELAISRTSTTLSPYYTAMALGATVVCSAGALMQHREPQHPLEGLPSDQTIVQSEQFALNFALNTEVVTPAIAAAPTAASFSPRGNSDRAVQAQYPAPQSDTDPLKPQDLVSQLQTQQAILVHRSTDLASLQTDLGARIEKSNQQLADLTARLAIHPQDAEHIANLLNLDTRYQVNRLNLSGLKAAIATQYSQPVAHNPQLESLYSQYAQELAQLRHIAQAVLADYLASVEVADAPWQDEEYYKLLQALMDVAHARQMQIIEHNTLAAMDAQLTQQTTELTALLE